MKLNLHLHTEYSDGNRTIEEMALWLQSMGHCCLVTSDHDYMMTPEKYLKQIEESKKVSEKLNFPIINALEISLWTEEAILVGNAACLKWLQERENPIHHVLAKNYNDEPYTQIHTYKAMPNLLNGMDYALCLVHPGLHEELDYSMFHAYEIMNSGSQWPEKSIAKMQTLMPTAKPVKGMDAHNNTGKYHLDSCNEIENNISNEIDLIKWIKGENK